MNASSFRLWLARLLGGLRDLWVALGIALIVFLLLDWSYRSATAISTMRASAPAVDSSLHPYGRATWYPELKRNLSTRHNHFDPYRSAWPDPVVSRYVNVDSAGRRRTPQPVPDAKGALHVVMLGGSVMWGFTSRDSFAIPVLVATRLASLGVPNVHVVNLAQAAFNSTQEGATLALEVAHGRAPDFAVVLDGFNDIATALAYREPGRTYADDQINQQIQLGRRGFWRELVGLGRHSALIAKLQAKSGRGMPPSRRSNATISETCGATARYFARIAATAAAVGRENGFPVIYFQQPQHVTGNKRLTAWERSLDKREGTRECADSLDGAMTPHAGTTYFSLRSIFDADSVTRFVDANAHLTEEANAVVADRIAAAIAPMLRERLARSGSTANPTAAP